MEIPLTKKQRFYNAINAISYFLSEMPMPYGFETAPTTTNNYKKFREDVLDTNIIVVSEEGCDKTIYDDPYTNQLARYWHDRIHMDEDLDFSTSSEVIVCDKQIKELEAFLSAEAYRPRTINDACEIIYHDIVGQAEYYEENTEFLEDQKAFVYERFLS